MKEEWKKVKLGTIATFSNGVNFGKESYAAGVKLIGVSNFGDRMFPDYESLQEIDEEVLRPNDYLKYGDIVFVRSNGNKELVGRSMLICKDIQVTYSGFCIRARLNDLKMHDPFFYTYYFKSNQFRKEITGASVGTNIQNLNQGILNRTLVPNPPLPTQQKIAAVLGAYDDLIENNRKQIKLLEEAAQKLYKEWFVELHFPGWENTKIVDGIPEGWKKDKVENFIEIKYGKDHKALENGDISVYGSGGFMRYVNKSLYEGESILIPRKGSLNNILYVDEAFWTVDTMFYTKMKMQNIAKYMYFYMKSFDFYGMNTGAAVPSMTVDKLNSMDILRPTEFMLDKFETIVKAYFEKIKNCQISVKKYQFVRDKLLPKLMNGEIDVSEIKLPTVEE